MKFFNSRISRLCLVAMAATTSSVVALAQGQQVRGVVVDAKGEPIIGATIRLKSNSGVGTLTDLDGKFVLNVPNGGGGAVLIVSYVGYVSQEVTASNAKNIILQEDNQSLKEVVVIGYGSMQKKDLTGSVTSISDKNFQKGAISTPSELLVGKVAGVQITQNGSPGAGSTIRIRGGASLNASNDPLIVIDGVPIDNTAGTGSPNILSTINPQDIASMNVLKDASATAIYGSRASNGVIIIETKRGKMGQDMQINFSTSHSIAEASRRVDLLDATAFRELVKNQNPSYNKYLGAANTDWQNEIYRLAYGTDNNISVSGATKNMPYRASAGLYSQDGILKTDQMQRYTSSFNLSPKFFDNHLSVDANLKFTITRNRFANQGAIRSAVFFDPTQPVRAAGFDKYGGYFTWLTATGEPNQLAPFNPVSMLEQYDNRSKVFRSLGNIKFDYKLHFLPELRLNLNLGYDYSAGTGTIDAPANYAEQWYRYPTAGQGGQKDIYKGSKRNLLLDFYANYNKEIKAISSRIDLMAGYSYQDWKTSVYNFPSHNAAGAIIPGTEVVYANDYPQNTLVSYYARLNWSLLDRYIFTATVRTDGSSRFSPENRWGIFPSFAFAWRMKEEGFLSDIKALSELKLRLGYGVTGQQDGIANYSYMPAYYLSENKNRYLFGNTYYQMYRPEAYDQNIKWEQTETYNAGIDFGFLSNRISGSVDVYFKKTKDLLNVIPVAAGSNFSNQLLTNVGNIENKGLEFTLNATPIQTDKLTWELSYNLTMNNTKITKLNATEDPRYLGVPTGGIEGGTGSNIQIHSVGYEPYTFFVYKQLYDAQGKPLEGKYADLNKDGIINDQDKYYHKSANPDVMMGLSTTLSYGKWSLSTALRASLGNYIYDNVTSSRAIYTDVLNVNNHLRNTPKTIHSMGVQTAQYFSDMYVQNASFVKMDNISLSYDFGKIYRGIGLRASATVQNVFTLSSYKGIDPERGIDNNLYPLPRTYSLNLAFTL